MNAIEAVNLGKCYTRKGTGTPTLFGALTGRARQTSEPFWCLRDVNFEIPAGRTIGVIGPNGSGKSSLLGLAAGTITPTEGRIHTHGRISSLLELGAGFHSELSGRENVFLNAALLGIPREDVRKKFDHIVDFAELREFIDMPVKHYSSGMYVRLGFSVAVEVDPDILLIDEVLAVGDHLLPVQMPRPHPRLPEARQDPAVRDPRPGDRRGILPRSLPDPPRPPRGTRRAQRS